MTKKDSESGPKGILFLIGLAFSLSACATLPSEKRSAATPPAPTEKKNETDEHSPQSLNGELLRVENELEALTEVDDSALADLDDEEREEGALEDAPKNIERKPGGENDPSEEEETEQDPENIANQQTVIPIEINQKVQNWIKYFAVKDRERFQRFLSRGESYREVVEEVLLENGVPSELYYLAMIESGFSNHAKSRVAATGMWQFMRPTGKHYGLESGFYVDERHDPIRATEAASKYLKNLHNMFQSWYLAIAAYNAGEGRIQRAIKRGRSRNFWVLAQKRVLPRETMEYVPKFLAAMIIGRHPEKFGFSDHQEPNFPNVSAVEIPSPVRLADVALISKVPLSELQRVNPHLLKGLTSPRSKTYEIWVPENYSKKVQQAAPRLLARRIPGLVDRAPAIQVQPRMHVVRSGDSIRSIARKYQISIAYLKKINGMSSNTIYIGSRLRLATPTYKHVAARVRKPASKRTVRRYAKSKDRIKTSSAHPRKVAKRTE